MFLIHELYPTSPKTTPHIPEHHIYKCLFDMCISYIDTSSKNEDIKYDVS